jgi:uncharacterized protein (TIRG00374 family)
MKKAVLKTFLGFFFSGVALLYLFFQIKDPLRLKIALLTADYRIIMAVMLLPLITLVIRAWRWHYLLRPVKRVGFMPLFSATSIGFMGNNLLPFRMGEIIRPIFIGAKEKISYSAALGTIFTERLLDLLSIFVIFFLVIFRKDWQLLSPSVQATLTLACYPIFVMFIGLLGWVILLKLRPEAMYRLIHLGLDWLSPKLAHIAERLSRRFFEGLASLSWNFELLIILMLSALLWFASGVFFTLVNLAFTGIIGHHLPYISCYFLLLSVAFAVSLPSSPGFIGVYHTAYTLVLVKMYDLPPDVALSMAIIAHAASFIPQTIMGLIALAWEWQIFLQIKAVMKNLFSQRSTPGDAARETE